MIIFICVLLVLLILLIFPVFFIINVEDEPEIYLRILYFIKVKLPEFDRDKPDKKEKKPRKSVKKDKKKSDILGTLREYADFLESLVKKSKNVLRKLRLRRLLLHVSISAESPDTTAILFGAACAVFYPALSLISSAMRFDPSSKRCDIKIFPDYSGSGSDIKVRAKIFFIPLALLAAAVSLAFTVFKGLNFNNKNTKGMMKK